MLVTNKSQKQKHTLFRKMTIRLGALSIFLVSCFIILFTIDGYAIIKDRAFLGKDINTPFMSDPVKMFSGMVRGSLNNIFNNYKNDFDTIYIDIGYDKLLKIKEKREEALKAGVLNSIDNDYQKASVTLDGKKINSKIRLKGDWVDHLKHRDKWSIRVKLKNNNYIYGVKKFSLQHPYTRGFQSEFFYYKLMSLFGISHPYYQFVNVVINGNNIGIMAFEEGFGREFIERNKRKEGVVLRFSEGEHWIHREINNDVDLNWYSYPNVMIDFYGAKRISNSDSLMQQSSYAHTLLSDFINGNKNASEVFDIDLMGKYLAIVELWGGTHSLFWTNQRFYYNPITSKLEPIAYDAGNHSFESNDPNMMKLRNSFRFISDVLDDEKIRASYLRNLNHIAKITLKKLPDLIKEEGELYLSLKKEFVLLDRIQWTDFERKLLKVTGKGPPIGAIYKTIISAEKRVSSTGESYIYLKNRIPYDVDIYRIKFKNKSNIEWSGKLRSIDTCNRSFDSNDVDCSFRDNIVAQETLIKIPNGIKTEPIIFGKYNDIDFVHKGYSGTVQIHNTINMNVLLKDFLKEHSYIYHKDGRLIFKKGKWNVKSDIITPKGMTVVVPSDTTLELDKSVMIIINGGLIMGGDDGGKVVLKSLNKSEKWSGLIILADRNDVSLNNVNVQDSDAPNIYAKNLTGAINIHNADIEINNMSINNIHAEDAINIVSSTFVINGININNSKSDGIDIDFSNGKIANAEISNIGERGGGDGIDISGSEVSVLDSYFKQIDDKAVSIGEGSKVKLSNLEISNSGYGVVVKDDSYANLKGIIFSSIKNIALMTYIKKSEYGCGMISATDMVFNNVNISVKKQNGCGLKLEGQEVIDAYIDVKNLYKTNMKKGDL